MLLLCHSSPPYFVNPILIKVIFEEHRDKNRTHLVYKYDANLIYNFNLCKQTHKQTIGHDFSMQVLGGKGIKVSLQYDE